MSDSSLSVGAVAKRCGVKVSTLHFYESKGLIHSWRSTGHINDLSRVDILADCVDWTCRPVEVSIY